MEGGGGGEGHEGGRWLSVLVRRGGKEGVGGGCRDVLRVFRERGGVGRRSFILRSFIVR